MEAHIRAPDPLSKVGNMPRNWNTWKEEFRIFMNVSGYGKMPSDMKADLFKNRIGPVGLEAIENLSFDNPKDKNNVDKLIAKLDLYFDPSRNEVLQRFRFFTRSKANNETIEQYAAELKEMAKTCNFGDITESLIRDKLVAQIKDKEFRKKVFETENVDLSKIILMYSEHERSTQKQTQKDNTNVEGLLEKGQSSFPVENRKGGCWRCGQKHPLKHCSAYRHKCQTCGGMNHFEEYCRKEFTKKDDKETNKYKFQASTHKNVLNPGVKANTNPKCDNFLQKTSPYAIIAPSVPEPLYPVPSAPPMSDADHALYPNLNHMKVEESKPYSSPNAYKTGATTVTNNLRQNTQPSNFAHPLQNAAQRHPGRSTSQHRRNVANTGQNNGTINEQDPESCTIS